VAGTGARLQESGIDESFFRLHALAVAGGRVSAAPGQVMSGESRRRTGWTPPVRRAGIAMPPRHCHQLPAERLCRSVIAPGRRWGEGAGPGPRRNASRARSAASTSWKIP